MSFLGFGGYLYQHFQFIVQASFQAAIKETDVIFLQIGHHRLPILLPAESQNKRRISLLHQIIMHNNAGHFLAVIITGADFQKPVMKIRCPQQWICCYFRTDIIAVQPSEQLLNLFRNILGVDRGKIILQIEGVAPPPISSSIGKKFLP